jgi:hypothetical protein
MKKGIIVLGMHRSGTSLAANLVYRCGVYAGGAAEDGSLLLQPDADNPAGYWEYKPLIHFNDELLSSVGANCYFPPSDYSNCILEQMAEKPSYRKKALGLINTMESGGVLWFWKDPRLVILLPFWERVWDNVIYVIPVRNPLNMALSLRKRDALPISASLLIWQRYMLSILKHTERTTNKLFVEYEKLIENPFEECKRLYLFISGDSRGDDMVKQTIETVTPAVRSDLQRNNSEVSAFFELPHVTAEQKDLYNFLKGKVRNPAEQFNAADFAVYAGWRDYLLTIDLARKLWTYLPSEKRQAAMLELPSIYREFLGVFN